MSVCGRVASCGSHGRRQWRGRRRRATAAAAFPKAFAGVMGRYEPRFAGAQESALQQRFDPLVEFLERSPALDLLAIDEKGRRRVDLQHIAGVLLIGGDLVE